MFHGGGEGGLSRVRHFAHNLYVNVLSPCRNVFLGGKLSKKGFHVKNLLLAQEMTENRLFLEMILLLRWVLGIEV